MPTLSNDEVERFWSKVAKGNPMDCWLWMAGKSKKGYGRFKAQKFSALAHRMAWHITHGRVPIHNEEDYLCVCHRCDVRSCCNPAHLFIGTNMDNVRDMVSKGRQQHGNRRGKSSNIVNGNAKLTPIQAIEIRAIYSQGDFTQREIAAKFNVTQACISLITSGRSWIQF